MYSTAILISLLSALATAVPAPPGQNPSEVQNFKGMSVIISDVTSGNSSKRSPEIWTSKNVMIVTVYDADETAERLARRKENYISSCGPKSGWIPVDNQFSKSDGTEWWGYESAVKEYC